MLRSTRIALVALLIVLAPVAGVSGPNGDCRVPTADCTLGEAARQAGIELGAFRQEADPRAGATIAAENSSVTVPVYWTTTQAQPGVFDFTAADEIVALAEQNGLAMRGHPLVWEQANLDGTPQWVTAITDADQLRAVLAQHVATVVGRYAGKIEAWDVVNEPIVTFGATPYPNHFRQLLGPGYIAEALAMARAADPDAKLFVNEVIVGLGPLAPAKLAAFLDLIRDLVAQGAPIDGVGFQGHLFFPTDAALLYRALREVEALGLIAELTEVDVPQRSVPDPDEEQGREYREIALACLASPACRRITVWGVSDAHSWLNWFLGQELHPLLFDEDYERKPAYYALRDALVEMIPRDLSGRKLALHDHRDNSGRRALALRAVDAAIEATGPMAFGDPTELGARLRLYNPSSGEQAVIDLPAVGWTAVGKDSGAYRYRNPAYGPCRTVLVSPGRKLSARCRGRGLDFTLDEAAQGTIVVELRIADAPLQCVEFGGQILRDSGTDTSSTGAGRFVARDAPASNRCSMRN